MVTINKNLLALICEVEHLYVDVILNLIGVIVGAAYISHSYIVILVIIIATVLN